MTEAATRAFPLELLETGAERRMLYFRDEVRIEHRNMISARAEVLNAITIAKPGDLVLVFGPTGVGKTTAANAVAKALGDSARKELITDPERYAVLMSKLRVVGTGNFSWSYNFPIILRAANEPLIDLKIPGQTKYSGLALPQYERGSVGRFEQAYLEFLKHRRPTAVILDDAHNMGKVPPKRLPYMLDYVWTLAESSKIPHVLPGTYDLLDIRDLSGQAAHRCIPVHFRRYTFENDDITGFAAAVKTLQGKMPVEKVPNFEAQLEYLMERSAGCIGILKEWLDRALSEALLTGAKTVNETHLKKTTLADRALTTIFSEIQAGEGSIFNQPEEYSEKLRFMRSPLNSAESRNPGSAKANESKLGRRRAPKPGNRNPKRDQIGGK